MRFRAAVLLIMFSYQNIFAAAGNVLPNPGAPVNGSQTQLPPTLLQGLLKGVTGLFGVKPEQLQVTPITPKENIQTPLPAVQSAPVNTETKFKAPALTATDQFIKSLAGDFSSETPSIRFSGDTFFLKIPGNPEILRAQLKMPNGQKLQGPIIGVSKNYIYTKPLPDRLLQWDVRNEASVTQRIIEFENPLVGFSVWGQKMHIVIQNEGLVSLDEDHSRLTQDKGVGALPAHSLGEKNDFLPRGIEMQPPTRIITVRKTGIRIYDFFTNQTEMISLTEMEPRDIKIGRLLGIQRGHIVFISETGDLVVLRLITGSKPNKIQTISGVERATAFYLDNNILHLFVDNYDKTYNISGQTADYIDTQMIEANGRSIYSAKRLSNKILTFDENGDLITASVIPQKVMNHDIFVRETLSQRCEEELSALKRLRLEREALDTKIRMREQSLAEAKASLGQLN